MVAFGSAAPLPVSAARAASVTTHPTPAEGGSGGAPLDASSSDDEEAEEEAAAAAAAAAASGRRGGKAAFIPDPAILAADIRMVLQGRVLPCLHSHLVEDEEVRGMGGRGELACPLCPMCLSSVPHPHLPINMQAVE